MGVFMLGLPAGIFLAYISAGAIATKFGWRAAFWFACVPGVILAIMALRMREPVRGALDAGRVVTTPARSSQNRRLPPCWGCRRCGGSSCRAFSTTSTCTPSTRSTPHSCSAFIDMSLLNASYVSSISVGAVGAIGLLVGGWLADKMSANAATAAWCCRPAAMASPRPVFSSRSISRRAPSPPTSF